MPVLSHLHSAEELPDVQIESPVFQLMPIAHYPSTGHQWKESVLFAPSLHYLQILVRFPQSLLQAGQSELSQPFLTGEVLQTLDHLSGLPLDSFQYVHAFDLLRSAKLDSVLPHQCWVEQKEHLSCPAGDTSPNATKTTVSLVCSKNTLLTHADMS